LIKGWVLKPSKHNSTPFSAKNPKNPKKKRNQQRQSPTFVFLGIFLPDDLYEGGCTEPTPLTWKATQIMA
jgi:hypothetical protein